MILKYQNGFAKKNTTQLKLWVYNANDNSDQGGDSTVRKTPLAFGGVFMGNFFVDSTLGT